MKIKRRMARKLITINSGATVLDALNQLLVVRVRNRLAGVLGRD